MSIVPRNDAIYDCNLGFEGCIVIWWKF